MRTRATFLAVLVALVGTSALAAPAFALQSGVFVNPNSPAGKEYSFPLDVLRGAAVGHAAPQGVAQPLFGVGIAAVRATSASTGGSAGRGKKIPVAPGGRGRLTSTGQQTAGHQTRSGARSGLTRRELASLIQPQSPTTQVALLALVVLLAGTLLGVAIVAVRRRG